MTRASSLETSLGNACLLLLKRETPDTRRSAALVQSFSNGVISMNPIRYGARNIFDILKEYIAFPPEFGDKARGATMCTTMRYSVVMKRETISGRTCLGVETPNRDICDSSWGESLKELSRSLRVNGRAGSRRRKRLVPASAGAYFPLRLSGVLLFSL
jgi:hypothetical protein